NGSGGQGTGFIISADGDVLTNSHVVTVNGVDAQLVVVELDDHRKLKGKIIARDPRTDVALVHIPTDHLQPLALGNSDELDPIP
ncbi:MAG: trypsin-like peptidase domain-containing protein, partial [Polyangia bacterium]